MGAQDAGVLSLVVFRNAVVGAGSFTTAGAPLRTTSPSGTVRPGPPWVVASSAGAGAGAGADGRNTVYGLAVYTPVAAATPLPPANDAEKTPFN